MSAQTYTVWRDDICAAVSGRRSVLSLPMATLNRLEPPVAPHLAKARPGKSRAGHLKHTLPVRMTATHLRDVDLMVYRMGLPDRAAVVRLAISIMAQEVEAAWYMAQIGGDPAPTESALSELIAVAMQAECAAVVGAHVRTQGQEAFGLGEAA